mgnify:CR=1 FL=1
MYFTGDGVKRDHDGYLRILGRVDDVINVSGHRMGTAEVENAINEYAKDNDCDGVEGIGREGFWNWIRKKDLGWKETARFFEFRFDGEKT